MNKFNNSAALTSKWFDDTIHESFAGWQPSGRGNILDFEPLSSPILNNPTKEFNFAELGTEYAEKLYFDLVDTMRSAKGIGLSANQVGVPLSVFVAETGGEYPEGFFNPRIVSVAQELVTLEEGCLSFKTGFVVPIKRPKTCRIRYQLLTGETVTRDFTGITCRCLLHERDHLDGIVMKQRVNRIIWERAVKKYKQLVKK